MTDGLQQIPSGLMISVSVLVSAMIAVSACMAFCMYTIDLPCTLLVQSWCIPDL